MQWKDYIALNHMAFESTSAPKLEKFVELLNQARKEENKIWVLGNGGSAATASHAVGDFCKTAKVLGGQPLFTLAPSEMTALQTAYANDISFEDGFALTLKDFAKSGDLVWIISVSGKSPNLLRAISQARSSGCTVVATVGTNGAQLEEFVDLLILIPSVDYQIVENAHILIMHWLTKRLAN